MGEDWEFQSSGCMIILRSNHIIIAEEALQRSKLLSCLVNQDIQFV